jgi:glycosyltransferase involved in cell wall biosynthesis
LIAIGARPGYAYSRRRTSPRQACLIDELNDLGVPLLDLNVGNVVRPSDILAYRRLSQFVDKEGFGIVHAHSFKAGLLARNLRQAPVIYTPNAYYSMVPNPSWSRKLVEMIERGLGRRALTINVSIEERDYAIEKLGIPEDLQKTIPNCVDLEHFRPASPARRREIRSRMGITDEVVLFGAVMRLTWQKDPHTLVRAFDLARDQDEELQLVVVGAGEMRNIKPRHPPTRIHRLEDTASFYQALDAFILTSRYEGLPLTVLEAMATNLPLILSDAPGNRGFGNLRLSNLRIVRRESSPAFAEAILELAARLRGGSERHPNHRTVAQQRFSPDAVYSQIDGIYREVGST